MEGLNQKNEENLVKNQPKFCPPLHTISKVQFLSKNSILIYQDVEDFDFKRKIVEKILGEKLVNRQLFRNWQLWYHEKNCRKFFG